MADKPFRLNGETAADVPVPARSPREPSLPNPPQGKWYPGIDQGSAAIRKGNIPFPPADNKGKI